MKNRIFPLSEQNCLEVETAPRLTWSRQVGVNLGTGVKVYLGKAVGVG